MAFRSWLLILARVFTRSRLYSFRVCGTEDVDPLPCDEDLGLLARLVAAGSAVPDGGANQTALNDLTLQIPAGQFAAVMGPSDSANPHCST